MADYRNRHQLAEFSDVVEGGEANEASAKQLWVVQPDNPSALGGEKESKIHPDGDVTEEFESEKDIGMDRRVEEMEEKGEGKQKMEGVSRGPATDPVSNVPRIMVASDSSKVSGSGRDWRDDVIHLDRDARFAELEARQSLSHRLPSFQKNDKDSRWADYEYEAISDWRNSNRSVWVKLDDWVRNGEGDSCSHFNDTAAGIGYGISVHMRKAWKHAGSIRPSIIAVGEKQDRLIEAQYLIPLLKSRKCHNRYNNPFCKFKIPSYEAPHWESTPISGTAPGAISAASNYVEPFESEYPEKTRKDPFYPDTSDSAFKMARMESPAKHQTRHEKQGSPQAASSHEEGEDRNQAENEILESDMAPMGKTGPINIRYEEAQPLRDAPAEEEKHDQSHPDAAGHPSNSPKGVAPVYEKKRHFGFGHKPAGRH